MKIQTVHFENFRLFDKLDINLHPSVNVFIGTNGAGKSAVLDGISLTLKKFIHLLLNGVKKADFIQKSDIKIGEKDARVESKVTFHYDNEVFIEIITEQKRLNKEKQHDLFEVISDLGSNFRERASSMAYITPILVYYNYDRMSVGNEMKSKNVEYEEKAFYTYHNAFATGTNIYKDFVEWFENAENYENHIIIKEDVSYKSPDLTAVRNAISSFLTKLSGIKIENLTIKRAFDSKEFAVNKKTIPDLILSKNGQELSFSQLSAGEKNILILVADIARRLAIAQHGLENILLGIGIVLIDEIDLHLHPSWQRNILSALHHTFPNIQFIVTTHSPQVLSNVAKESVFILNDGKLVAETPHTEGRDSNSILFELFGEEKRPILYRKKLEGFYDELAAENIENAEQILAELTEKWGQYDTEIVRANLYLNDAKN